MLIAIGVILCAVALLFAAIVHTQDATERVFLPAVVLGILAGWMGIVMLIISASTPVA